MISSFVEIQGLKFVISDYSNPGYWIVCVKSNQITQIKDQRSSGHNSGCTSMQMLPGFNELTYPYIICRSKFHVELVDLTNKRIETLATHMNSSGMHSKLAISTLKNSV